MILIHNRIEVSISMIIISTKKFNFFLRFKVFKETFILSGTFEYIIEN